MVIQYCFYILILCALFVVQGCSQKDKNESRGQVEVRLRYIDNLYDVSSEYLDSPYLFVNGELVHVESIGNPTSVDELANSITNAKNKFPVYLHITPEPFNPLTVENAFNKALEIAEIVTINGGKSNLLDGTIFLILSDYKKYELDPVYPKKKGK